MVWVVKLICSAFSPPNKHLLLATDHICPYLLKRNKKACNTLSTLLNRPLASVESRAKGCYQLASGACSRVPDSARVHLMSSPTCLVKALT